MNSNSQAYPQKGQVTNQNIQFQSKKSYLSQHEHTPQNCQQQPFTININDVKSPQKSIYQLQQGSKQISIDQNNIDDNMECGQFQVVIHKISSKQSIPNDDQDEHQILFTKSELQIPIDLQEPTQNHQQHQQDYVNIWHKHDSQDDDIYVKMLGEKFDKKDSQNNSKQIKSTQFTQTSQDPLKFLQQLCMAPSVIQESTPKQNLLKKAGFVIKKIKDDKFNYSILDSLKVKKQTLQKSILENKSDFLNVHQSKEFRYQRFGKKHASNFQTVNNSFRKDQQNVQYKMFFGNEIQKMSQILEDRCYNNIVAHKEKENVSNSKQLQKGKSSIDLKQDSYHKVRKIIKRSPYGILQLQVKDKKNQAKITNLRILKPKQMIRLKKLPNIIKNNKENIFL